jgi:three-Cys-motif partner protein
MSLEHSFGGAWTEEKLDQLRKYLAAYMRIFAQNPKAAWYKTIYVDAFAGTGYRPGLRSIAKLPGSFPWIKRRSRFKKAAQ